MIGLVPLAHKGKCDRQHSSTRSHFFLLSLAWIRGGHVEDKKMMSFLL